MVYVINFLSVLFSHPGGGGGYSYFFRIRRLGAQHLPFTKKNIRNFKHPKKIFETLAIQKISQFCTLTLQKDPIMHRNDPLTSPILWWPPIKISTKSSYPQKYSFFWKSKTILKFRILNPPKNSPSLRMCENIRVPPPLGLVSLSWWWSFQTVICKHCRSGSDFS